MEIKEYFSYREQLLEDSKDSEGCIAESNFLRICMPNLNETKLTDSEDFNDCYTILDNDLLKINGYSINESGERLQIFIVNDESLDLRRGMADLCVSQKAIYDKQFLRAVNFVKKSIKGQLNDAVQDSSPAKKLIQFLCSADGISQIDVIEFFLVSATSTVEIRGETPQPKRIEFEEEAIKATYTQEREKKSKEIVILKRLIDLNFLYDVLISQGNREVLEIDFEKLFNQRILCLKAADDDKFESYLGVIPATILADLYKRYSSRLLEKNVRSFLQFKGVNQGMRDTIRKEPEKFIAYNNGLTITATHKKGEQINGQYFISSLSDFQIVNGGQTTASIYFSKKDGLDVNKISIMAKINVVKSQSEDELDELIANISNYSNAQSKVSKVDLRSRNPQLIKIKTLSESILSPSGKKWYFERAKGEFNTLLRKSPSQKNRINKEFPRERRFSKEDLAKYYMAWGEQPYTVKKGGEKVFRYFVEAISGGEKNKRPLNIDRSFYEELIARILLFRTLEKIYGAGPNSMGQLRAAVVPYSISVLHYACLLKGQIFDLSKLWANEGLEADLQVWLTATMDMINKLIKKYSKSEDFNEYSKKEELWTNISESKELKDFLSQPDAKKIIDKYAVNKAEYEKRRKKTNAAVEVDFEDIYQTVRIYQNSSKYYRNLRMELWDKLTKSELSSFDQLILSIEKNENLNKSLLDFEKKLTTKLLSGNPEIFDKIEASPDDTLVKTLDFIVKEHSVTVDKGESILSVFQAIEKKASLRSVKYASVFSQMGKDLTEGKPPTIKQLNQASNYCKELW